MLAREAKEGREGVTEETKRESGRVCALTFSRPKNLSLPSSRIGPALRSNLSTGVRSWPGSSFLFFADVLPSDFEIPWERDCQPGCAMREAGSTRAEGEREGGRERERER